MNLLIRNPGKHDRMTQIQASHAVLSFREGSILGMEEISVKATGIVRRIDDLGRVVIPKEIRRTLRIRESDPLEIFTDHEGAIILKKYSPIGELGSFAKQYAESLSQVSGHLALIADRDQIIAAAGSNSKQVLGKSVSKALEEKNEFA